MDRQTDRQTDRQIDEQTDRWMDGRTDGWTDRRTDTLILTLSYKTKIASNFLTMHQMDLN